LKDHASGAGKHNNTVLVGKEALNRGRWEKKRKEKDIEPRKPEDSRVKRARTQGKDLEKIGQTNERGGKEKRLRKLLIARSKKKALYGKHCQEGRERKKWPKRKHEQEEFEGSRGRAISSSKEPLFEKARKIPTQKKAVPRTKGDRDIIKKKSGCRWEGSLRLKKVETN